MLLSCGEETGSGHAAAPTFESLIKPEMLFVAAAEECGCDRVGRHSDEAHAKPGHAV